MGDPITGRPTALGVASVAAAGNGSRPAIDRFLDGVRVAIEPRAHPHDLAGVLDRGGLVVDIRPIDLRERDGLLPGAIVVGRNVLEWRLDPTSPDRIAEVTGPDQEIVVLCDEGYASSLAAATLRQIGLHRATDLVGGMQVYLRWRAGAA